tara:strand:+ start:634 stop:1530 length:897 start_codon:yes stop_codon:yes gene_type:complete
MLKFDKVGVTGGSGMLGQHLIALLKMKGVSIVDVRRDSWDLTNWKSKEEINFLFQNVDAVFHFGAAIPSSAVPISTKKLFDTNARSCIALAEWALGTNIPISFVSSSTVYRDPHSLNIFETDEKTAKNFGGLYGFSKLLAEQILSHYTAYGLKLVILRPSSIYGVGLGEDKLVKNFLAKAERAEVIELDSRVDAANAVNFVHASDVAWAAMRSLENAVWGEYNIPGPKCYTIEELAQSCVKLVKKGKVVIKEEGIEDSTPFVRFDLDYTNARKVFGYEPSIDLEEGLSMILNQIHIKS